MAEQQPGPGAPLDPLGGTLGRYVIISVALSVLWFPFRLWLDRGDPLAAIIAASGLSGAMYALMVCAALWPQQRRLRKAARSAGHPDTGRATDRRAESRRGGVLGLSVGVPFFCALIVLCVSTGRSWVYSISFTVVTFTLAAVAIRNLRRNAKESLPGGGGRELL